MKIAIVSPSLLLEPKVYYVPCFAGSLWKFSFVVQNCAFLHDAEFYDVCMIYTEPIGLHSSQQAAVFVGFYFLLCYAVVIIMQYINKCCICDMFCPFTTNLTFCASWILKAGTVHDVFFLFITVEYSCMFHCFAAAMCIFRERLFCYNIACIRLLLLMCIPPFARLR